MASSGINLLDIYLTGMQVEETDKAESEAGKIGNLRAGNTGVVDEDGIVLGKCPRKAYLRQQGIPHDSHSLDRLLMFSAGFASEDIWYERLSKGWPGTILREEETPIEWTTRGGTKVTGRPDMVLVDGSGKHVCVLELKNVSSLWTARSVLSEGTPKFDHLAQAGHYSWQLGIPGKLCYSLYLDMAVMGWAQKLFPAPGDKYSEYCEYNEKGEIKKVKPFLVVYDLRWGEDGYLEYRPENEPSSGWTPSPITMEGIERYYEMTAEMDAGKGKELPPRPLTVKGNGTPENWSACSYCPLAETCDRYESNPKRWLDAVLNLRWDGK